MEGGQPSASPGSDGTKIGRLFNHLHTLLEQQDEVLVALDRLAPQVYDEEEAGAAYRSVVAQETHLADATADTAAALLLAPVERACDLQLKLMVLIAACEPHRDDADIFPSLYLRALLTDLRCHTLSIKRGIHRS